MADSNVAPGRRRALESAAALAGAAALGLPGTLGAQGNVGNTSDVVQFRLDLPRESLADERAAAGPAYELGPETGLPPDPDAVEARFIEPVTLIVTVTLAMLAWRIVNHFLIIDGRGVLIDARQKPPVVSRLEDVPAGFIVLIKADGSSETIAAGKIDDAGLASLIAKALPAGG